jgi:glyoxylase I family protein
MLMVLRATNDVVLEALGFKRFGHPAEHASWSNGKFSITLRPAAPELAGVAFNRYRVGLHHLALKVKERADVDALHRLLLEKGATVLDPPAEYPEYEPATTPFSSPIRTV